jgi:hypothetical protein
VHIHGAQKIAQSAVDVAQLALVEMQARNLIHMPTTARNGATVSSPVRRRPETHQFVGSPFAPHASTDFSSEARAPRSRAPAPVMPGTVPEPPVAYHNPSKVFKGAPLANPLSPDGPLSPMRGQTEPEDEEPTAQPLPPNASPEETET